MNNNNMIPRFILAPMAELSHRALRELIESFRIPEVSQGADEYFSEMISAGALLGGGPFEEWYADNAPRPEKLVYQLAGGSAEQIVKAANLLDKRECLGIDINMGCSAPAITRTGAGVKWMADTEKAASLIRLVRRQTSRRLSVKLRIGFKDDFEYLAAFCRRLEDEGIDLITLHPRTAGEKFKRRPRWEYISALKKELHVPVAGNGDIASPEEMLRRSKECDAVMIGRLAVKRPWIFAEAAARGKAVTEANTAPYNAAASGLIEETGLLFLDLLGRHQPPEFHASRARRFFHYFCDNLKWANHVKNLLGRETGIAGMEKAWKRFFAEQGESLEEEAIIC